MKIERLIKINILLWGVLVISLAMFLLRHKKAGTENGVGGAIRAEEFVMPAFDDEAVDFELEGIPEPEEFSRPHMLTFSSYTMEKGDIVGNIAIRTGLNEDTIISVNDIKNTRLMQIGQVLKIPNQDGVYYSVKSGETLESIAEKYNTTVAHIKTANELFSEAVPVNTSLFIPGAKLDWTSRQEINGDLFIWPTAGRISSPYGYRIAPFAGVRMFHTGIDIAAPTGTPIKAAMAGRVTQVGTNDESWGNFVVISHHSGYRTFYAHMSVVRVKVGAYVETGGRIGDVGSTGLSTGPHVHFTVYKNGVTVNPLSLMRN
jgi:murein DD-endopeptidase MepM/ murein hydrolase activator NlpD